ncbi:MAG: hypothetical protein LC637_02575 [Xanthomonadaceae bacterium]|nr:hypothetical protein [Xanthomonadaceae bacterium]
MKINLSRMLLWLLAWLPLSVIRLLGALLGWLASALPWRKRTLVRANLARAFPKLDQPEVRLLARRSMVEIARTALEVAPLWHRDADWIDKRIASVRGWSHIDRAMAAGRGLLVLGGHLGQWELSILYGSLNLPIAYLYKAPKSTEVDRVLTRHRQRFGAELIPTGGLAMRRAVRQLRSGQALGMLFDQLPKGGDSVRADFFGQPVETMSLPWRLIRSTGCAVVMGHCLRNCGARGWQIVIEPVPLADHPDPVVALSAINQVLEQAIRRAPAQYLWQYRRFDQCKVGAY